MAIQSFRCRDTLALFDEVRIAPSFRGFADAALRKLAMLERAGVLNDLKVPPGNQLEALKGGRKGQYSIRINKQWRICFTWSKNGPANVEIVDYH